MSQFKFYLRIFGTICIIIISWCFLLYPAMVTLRIAIDPSFRKAQLNNYTLHMFYKTSKRYNEWAEYYLKTQYAATKASHEDSVASTEWPMFGSIFYLLTAEEIKQELDKRKSGSNEKIYKVMLKASDFAAKIVADPVTGTWVKKMWGKDYLTKQNVFYRMLIIMGLSSYEKISGKTTYRTLLETQALSLADELTKAKYHLAEDYPGECYPNDVLWSVAAILRTDSLLTTHHHELAEQLMQILNKNCMTNKGLPSYMADPEAGKPYGIARGCANSGILLFAPELDKVIAKQWYQKYEEHYWKDNGFCRGFREYYKGFPDNMADVDSGPVIKGYGSAATVFGIGAARRAGRLDHALPMTQEILVVCWPTPFGLLLPGLMGKLMVDSSSLGETALLFSMTRPILETDVIPYAGRTPLIVWTAFLVYLIPGLILLWMEYRSWKKWLRKSDSGIQVPKTGKPESNATN
jgi:hypothetical protein